MTTLLGLIALTTTFDASAAVIHVVPGPGTPLQDAIDAAAPGDTILSKGIFHENIVIDKPITVTSRGQRIGTALDAGCSGASTIRITASGVRLSRVAAYGGGGADAVIDISGVDDVELSRVSISSRPFEGACTDSERGVVVAGSTRVRLRGVRSSYSGPGAGFGTAFIAIRDIAPGADVRVAHAFTNYEQNGADVLVEGVVDTPGGKPAVRIASSQLVGGPTGVRLASSVGVQVMGNYIAGHNYQSPEPDAGGVVLEATTSGNRVTANRFYLNVPHVRDLGSGNVTAPNQIF